MVPVFMKDLKWLMEILQASRPQVFTEYLGWSWYFSPQSVKDHVLWFFFFSQKEKKFCPCTDRCLSAAAALSPLLVDIQESSQYKKSNAAVNYCLVSE